jgi:hypothetical protein
LGARNGSGRDGGKGAEAFSVPPFARLARAHAFSAGGDALVAIALADSLFFSIDPNDARWRVTLYLLLTMAPFAVVAPFLGPAMDRLKGGHRFMLIGSALARSVLVVAMAFNVQSLLLFPLAFSMLVMGKTHHIAKSALVPTTVHDAEGLVRANSRLSVLSALASGVAGLPGVALLRLFGSGAVLGFAGLVFIGGAALGTRIGATRVAPDAPTREERAELRGAGIIIAASAMGYVRGVVGFLTMLLAFELRGGVDPGPTATGVEIGHAVRRALGQSRIELASGGAPTWHFGVVLVALGIGGMTGAVASPKLREMAKEERILAGALGQVGVVAVLATFVGGLSGAMLIAFSVAMAGTSGKQAFDAIVQRDAPEANLGRSFARFESRFQLVWVVGAIIPVIVPLPSRVGFAMIAAASLFAAISYWLGRDPAPTQNVPKERVDAVRRRVSSGSRDRDGQRRILPRRRRAAESDAGSGRRRGDGPDTSDGSDGEIDRTDQYAFPPSAPPPSGPPPR